MMYLVVIIVDDPDHCEPLLEAWRAMGVSGATILDSTGMGRMTRQGLRDDMPLMPRLADFLAEREEPHRTMFSVVEDEATADRMAEAAQTIIGDLNQPDSGFMFVVPVLKAYGLDRGKEG